MDKKETKHNRQVIESYDYLGAACSSMDCTGLIPRGVTDPAELNAYEDIYPFRPPQLYPNSQKD